MDNQKKATAYKIPGEFLKIEDEPDGYFKIHCVNASGKISWHRMEKENISEDGKWAEAEILRLKAKLAETKSEAMAEEIRGKIEHYEMETLWPEMYKAHCKGQSLSAFFTVQPDKASETESTRATLKKMIKEHSLITKDLTPTQRLRLQITMELKNRHGDLKVTSRALYLLSPKLKQEARDIAYTILENNPRAKVLVDAALQKPKKSKKREEQAWTLDSG